jgi:methylated-DNA-[protein]-cysteine S-methyltransferase
MNELERELRMTRVDPAAAIERLRERADRDGLLDVAYATVESPMGTLTVAATPTGLVALGLPNRDPEEVVADLAARVSPRVLEAPGRLDEVRRELDLYFEGRLRDFDLPLDWQLTGGFRRRVLRQTARIPYGRTLSYKQVAKRAGNERAMRAAGSALGSNPIPIVVPCHRVLRTGGALGGYGGGLEMKEALLRLEGALE